ncbi:MAG: nucleoside deaminase [Proteobacteria bacterium]|nr:nucleoside deaminase [Pseudomonadota bacterium]
MDQNHHMKQALTEAKAAGARGEVPVGAIVVDSITRQVIAVAGNETECNHDPTAHAELLALQRACKIKGTPRLPGCDLYVTLEPCPMCATALSFARIRRLYFGAYDPKSGGVDHGPKIFSHAACHHQPEVYGGIQEQECGEILKEFFRDKR